MTIFRMTLKSSRSSVQRARLVATAAGKVATARVGARGLAAARLNRRDRQTVAAEGRNLLDALELDLGAPVVEQRAQLRVLRIAQVALRLHHEEVRREAHLESTLLGGETLLGE